jgi:two-component system sensor kinase FixL
MNSSPSPLASCRRRSGPCCGSSGRCSTVANQSADGVREMLGEKMEAVEREARQAWRFVSELLDLSQIRLGRFQLEPQETDLAKLTQETASSLREEVEQTGSELTVQAERPAVGRWDPLRIKQVVANLLVNAMKLGEGKPIFTKVDADPERARVEVEVEGVGIAPEDQARIFDPFERAVAAGTVAGLGLGLYIARQIVQAHGGTILLRSQPRAGSTFTVELPRLPPSSAAPPAER